MKDIFHLNRTIMYFRDCQKGRNISLGDNAYTDKAVGLDPGFGSSNFGVCITEVRDGIVNVLHTEEYSRPDYNTMIQTTISLLDKYGITRESGCRIYTDGSNSAFTSSLKRAVYEDPDYTRQIEYLKKTKPSVFDFEYLKQCMFVLPVHFSKEHKAMLAHCKEIVEDQGGMLAINPRFTKLVTALRTAVENGEGSLDKEATSHDDLFDVFRLSLMHWRRK